MVKKGYKQTKEHRKNSSSAHKEQHSSPKTEFKIGQMAHLGYKHSEETKRKMSINRKGKLHPLTSGKLNGMWKGDKVGRGGLHIWVKRNKPKPELCECCNKNKPYDVANLSGNYKRDINDFRWICRSCHMKEDGRLKNLLKVSHLRKILRDKSGKFIKKMSDGYNKSCIAYQKEER